MLERTGLVPVADTGPTRKGGGFDVPTAAHEHWHINVSYLNIAGTFYCLCAVLEGARVLVGGYAHEYNTERLHSAIGYITPADKLEGRAGAISASRQRKLGAAQETARTGLQSILCA